jgi:AcrR family transcriptional regulator
VPRISDAERPLRRQRLIDAAWRCLARGSFLELRVEDVCGEAELSKGSFYGYFDSKRALLYALVDDDLAVLEAMAPAVDSGPANAIGRLRAFALAVLRSAEDRPRVQLRADAWAAAAEDPDLARRLREGIARRRAMLRGFVEAAVAAGELGEVPANALASVLLALADGLTLHHNIDPTGFRWRNVRAAVDVLLSGLARV